MNYLVTKRHVPINGKGTATTPSASSHQMLATFNTGFEDDEVKIAEGTFIEPHTFHDCLQTVPATKPRIRCLQATQSQFTQDKNSVVTTFILKIGFLRKLLFTIYLKSVELSFENRYHNFLVEHNFSTKKACKLGWKICLNKPNSQSNIF